MSEEELIEYVAGHTGQNRRKFIQRLLVGAAFAAPVIASFSIGGASSPKRSPLDAGANLPDCGPNGYYFDSGSNMYIDYASNLPCNPDSGSNTTTTTAETTTTTAAPTTTTPVTTTTAAGSGGSVTTTTGLDSGAGTAPGEIPSTK